MNHRAVARGFLATASTIALVLGTATAAIAQDGAATETEEQVESQVQSAPPAASRASTEEITITGSRIRRPPGVDAPVPVTVIGSEEVMLSGRTNVADIVRELPGLGQGVNLQGDPVGDGAVQGLNLLDLRRLGVERTLVLVNGRRHVGSQAGNTAVDISTIPPALIDRVEVLTGGASAVYGADAVSGVVNFILKENFDGLQIDVQNGISQEGDAHEQYYSVTAGTNFLDDRGNVTFSASYNSMDPLYAVDRDFTSPEFYFAANRLDTGPNDGIPANITTTGNRFIFPAPGGMIGVPLSSPANSRCNNSITAGPFGPSPRDFYTIDEGTGALRCFVLGDPTGSAAVRLGGDGLVTNELALLRSQLDRVLLHGGFNFEFSPSAILYASGKFAKSESNSLSEPVYDTPNPALSNPITVLLENPFLPQELRDAMIQNNRTSIIMTKGGHDLGQRRTTNDRSLYQVTVGLRGELPVLTDWTYDTYFQHGESRTTVLEYNRLEPRDQMSLDAVRDPAGNIVCRVSLPASDPRFVANISAIDRAECSPRNPFGARGGNSQAAIDFLMREFTSTSELKQDVFHASSSGDLFALPGGDAGLALGVEWRRETSRSTPDVAKQLGLDFPGVAVQPARGSFSVKEAFAEIRLPLLSDLPFIHMLNVEAAARVADYSTIGTAVTWKVAGDWSPVRDVRLRASFSKSVRAPNIGELFSPASSGSTGVIDPCDRTNLGDQANPALRENRIRNCTTLVGDPNLFNSFAELTQQPLLTSGNPDLNEETAETITIGGVVTPRWLPNLSLTVDYWKIKISDAVGRFPINDTLANCVDSASLDNPFCSLIDRFPLSAGDNGGQIQLIRSQAINVAALKASGIDFEANLRLPLFSGTLRLNAIATYLDQLDFLANEERPEEVDRRAGEAGNPHWLGQARATFSDGPLTLSWQLRYVGSAKIDNNFTTETHDQNRVNAEYYNNFQTRYEIMEGVELFGGVDNVFNNIPPRIPPRGLQIGAGTAGSLYDNRGRFFYGGARIKL